MYNGRAKHIGLIDSTQSPRQSNPSGPSAIQMRDPGRQKIEPALPPPENSVARDERRLFQHAVSPAQVPCPENSIRAAFRSRNMV